MTSSHNAYSAQYRDRFSREAAVFKCMECGEHYPDCLCNASRRNERLKTEYADWIGDRISLRARDGQMMPGKRFLFATLTFGCTRCGGAENNHMLHGRYESTEDGEFVAGSHDYLKPGPQMGRKRFKKYWDDMNHVLIQTVKDAYVDVVYGAEERGTSNLRLHYHSIIRMHGDVPDDVITTFRNQWTSGWSKIEWLTSPDRALAYVSEYIAKTETGTLATPFFFFEYEPKSALDIVELT
jgi:hypothetical protein